MIDIRKETGTFQKNMPPSYVKFILEHMEQYGNVFEDELSLSKDDSARLMTQCKNIATPYTCKLLCSQRGSESATFLSDVATFALDRLVQVVPGRLHHILELFKQFEGKKPAKCQQLPEHLVAECEKME